MPRKKTSERDIRKLTKLAAGSSMGITLPIEVVRKFGWRERQKLKLKINNRNHSILIKDWKEKKTIKKKKK